MGSDSKEGDCDAVLPLDWSNFRLVGREEESRRLEEYYMTRKDCDLVLVTGPLGIGKSALTSNLQYRVAEDSGILVRGTFSVSPEPYEAFVEAFTDLVEQLRRKKDYKTIQLDLKQAISKSGAEKFLIPEGPFAVLQTLMSDGDDNAIQESSSNPGEEKKESMEVDAQPQVISATDRQLRLVNALTKIIEAMGVVFPLVIVLDNLMWADPGSILLLEFLCLTGKLPNVLMVATCRGDEVGYQDLLSIKLRSMEDRGIRLKDISLQPLAVEDTFLLVKSLQSHMSEEISSRLAVTIHECTGGVPLLICELLIILEKEGPNSAILRKQLDYSDLVDTKLRQMPSDTRQILQLIACLGGRAVHESVLTELIPGKNAQEMRSALLVAQEKGLLALDSKIGECAFLHGSVQVATYGLIPESERGIIHYDIARRLCSWLSDDQLEENVFLVVDQYLHGRQNIPDDEKAMVAELCLRAARKAAHTAAFSSAGDFIRFGISLLPTRTKWRDHYDLTLALANVAIELEFCNGNHDAVDILHKEILHNAREVIHTMTSYTTRISSLGTRGNHTKEAIEEGLDALELLGEKMPRRMHLFRTITGLIRTKKMLKRTSDEEILSLPPLTDAKIQVVSNILHLLFVYVFLQQSPLVPLVSMRTIELTLQYGLSPMSKYHWPYCVYFCL
jgi:predicted ATPase